MATTEIVNHFVVTNSAGADADADSLPVGTVILNGYPVSDVPYVAPASGDGAYTGTLTIDVEDNDVVQIRYTATTDAAANNWYSVFIVNVEPSLTTISETNRDAVLNRVLSGNHDVAGTPGKLIQSVTEARMAQLDADITSLVADWIDGGRLDLLIDAIKAKTDLLGSGTVNVTTAVTSDGTMLRNRAKRLVHRGSARMGHGNC